MILHKYPNILAVIVAKYQIFIPIYLKYIIAYFLGVRLPYLQI